MRVCVGSSVEAQFGREGQTGKVMSWIWPEKEGKTHVTSGAEIDP